MKEKDLQKAVEQYLKLKQVVYIHPTTRCPKCGMTFNHAVGFPDICFISGGIELKVGKNKQQAVQKEVEKFFKKKGLKYVVCRTLEEAIDVIDRRDNGKL